jgi:hypothetical protein
VEVGVSRKMINRTTDQIVVQLNELSRGVRVLSESFMDEPLAELAVCAYDAGLATVYFGKQSAIAEGARRKLGDVLWDTRVQQLDRETRRLIRTMGQFGRQHGAFYRARANDKRRSVCSNDSAAKIHVG